jgi:hypothetical protein
MPLYHWFTEGHTRADLQDAKLALDSVQRRDSSLAIP